MMRAALLALALLAPILADAPAPQTVAGCSTDMECENGPDPRDPWGEAESE